MDGVEKRDAGAARREALAAEGRCPSWHYWTGWACQREPGHTGPHMADAGINGGQWSNGRGGRNVYAWTEAPGDVACNQRQATDEEITASRR